MITQGFDFIALIIALCGGFVWIEKRYPCAFFRYFPSIILVMFMSMTLYSLHVWQMSPHITQVRNNLRVNMIPAMLFLMALNCNLSLMRKLGIKLLILFLGGTLSVMLGFVVAYALMHPWLGKEILTTFGVMSAGWTGGTQNFVAVKEALNVSDSAMSYTLLMGACCYTLWLTLILSLNAYKAPLNRFLRATQPSQSTHSHSLKPDNIKAKPLELADFFFILGLALLVSVGSGYVGHLIAHLGYLNPMIWSILIATLVGTIGAHTPLRLLSGHHEVSTIFLYVIVALIGAEVNLSALTQAPLYLLSGLVILAVHGLCMLGLGRLLKMDFHMVGLASIANIGSAPSAAVVAATYNKNLMSVGIIMALIGSLVGSFVGLGVSYILTLLSQST